MIQPQEIRIGSYLLYDGKPDRVTCIDLDLDDEGVPLVSFSDSSPVELNYGRIEPIPLNNDVFAKIHGVKKWNADYFEIDLPRGDINYDNNKVSLNYGFYVDLPGELPITNLHQLQNLYHALTGEELTIKL